jgi:hypothetical protein
VKFVPDFLPAYPPNLNLIERLWKFLREHAHWSSPGLERAARELSVPGRKDSNHLSIDPHDAPDVRDEHDVRDGHDERDEHLVRDAFLVRDGGCGAMRHDDSVTTQPTDHPTPEFCCGANQGASIASP